ncbi:MAG: hypothetical protein NXY57DRAFT_556153 [Lentinula lateritia]|nr:MAG: hypothetical protein NXY57DRAFT_556153 [Lentinula lateritia]
MNEHFFYILCQLIHFILVFAFPPQACSFSNYLSQLSTSSTIARCPSHSIHSFNRLFLASSYCKFSFFFGLCLRLAGLRRTGFNRNVVVATTTHC